MLFLLLPIAVTRLVGSFGALHDTGPDWASPDLIATAAYAGVIFGFLQAALTIATQQRRMSLTSLTSMIARRYHAYEILAFTGGVAAANVVTAFLDPFLPLGFGEGLWIVSRDHYPALLVANMIVMPIMSVASVWLLAGIVSGAGSQNFRSLAPVLEAATESALSNSRTAAHAIDVYPDVLSATGLEHRWLSGTVNIPDRVREVPIRLEASGQLLDIDCYALRAVAQDKDQNAAIRKILLSVIPSGMWNAESSAVVVLSADQPTDEVSRWATKHALPRLRRALVIAEPPSDHHTDDLRQLYDDLTISMREAARDGRQVQLERGFEFFHQLLDIWLAMAPPNVEPTVGVPRLWSAAFAGPMEVDLAAVAESASLSMDPSTVETVARNLFQGTIRCMKSSQLRLADHLLGEIIFLYYQTGRHPDCLDALGTEIDNCLDSLRFACGIDGPVEAAEADSRYGHFLTVLRFGLSITHAAIRQGETKHACLFTERVFRLDPSARTLARRMRNQPVQECRSTVLDFVAILFIGWSLEVSAKGTNEAEDAAKRVLALARERLVSREELIALWELFTADSPPDPSLSGRLGVSRWDVRDWDFEWRRGIGRSRTGGGEWQKRGLQAALLITRKSFVGELERVCPGQPSRFMWRPDNEKIALEALALNPVLEISEDDRDKRVNAACELIKRRAWLASAEHLRFVLDTAVPDGPDGTYVEAIFRNIKDSSWIQAFKAVGFRNSRPIASPFQAWIRQSVHREDLIRRDGFENMYAAIIATELCRREAIQLIAAVEYSCGAADYSVSLKNLPLAVDRARAGLVSRGFRPNMLILPDQDRFTRALFGRPAYEIEPNPDFIDASIGNWNDLEVLRCPYRDTDAVLLLDSRSCFATFADERPRLSVSIDDNPVFAEFDAARRTARKALDSHGEPLPASSTIESIVSAVLIPELGLADLRAAAVLKLDQTAKFAVPVGSVEYHRPACNRLGDGEVKYFLSEPHDSTPCTECRPDEWDLGFE